MNKFVVACIASVGLAVGALLVAFAPVERWPIQFQASVETNVAEFAEQPSPSPSPSPVIAEPQTLVVPDLEVTALVENVALDPLGRMDVPKLDENVGWYQLGPRPGDRGQAVVAGHYDAKNGGPAVFYKLDQLQPGDEVKIVGKDQRELVFVVTRTAKYPDSAFPIQEVFADDGSGQRRLNLITCAGQFDRQASNYTDRFVVYTVLKSDLSQAPT